MFFCLFLCTRPHILLTLNHDKSPSSLPSPVAPLSPLSQTYGSHSESFNSPLHISQSPQFDPPILQEHAIVPFITSSQDFLSSNIDPMQLSSYVLDTFLSTNQYYKNGL